MGNITTNHHGNDFNCRRWLQAGTLHQEMYSSSSHILLVFFPFSNSFSFFCYSMFQNSHFCWIGTLKQWNQMNFFYHHLGHLVPICSLNQRSQKSGNPGRSAALSTPPYPLSSLLPSPLISHLFSSCHFFDVLYCPRPLSSFIILASIIFLFSYQSHTLLYQVHGVLLSCAFPVNFHSHSLVQCS